MYLGAKRRYINTLPFLSFCFYGLYMDCRWIISTEMEYDIVHRPVLRFMSVSEMERVAPAPDSVSSTAAAAATDAQKAARRTCAIDSTRDVTR